MSSRARDRRKAGGAVMIQEFLGSARGESGHRRFHRKIEIQAIADPVDTRVVVGKAYHEPRSYDYVEDLLLARDYIID